MGNFSISHFTELRPHGDELYLTYHLDIAELPSVEEMHRLDADRDGTVTPAEKTAYLTEKVQALAANLVVTVNAAPVHLSVVNSSMLVRPGAADLPTILILVEYHATLPRSEQPVQIAFRDDNYPARAGWKEIVAVPGNGWRVVQSTAPETNLSQGLLNYPADKIAAPPQLLQAKVTIAPDQSATTISSAAPSNTAPVATSGFSPRDRFTQLISTKQITWGFMILALGVAFAMGAVHALAPGHGKTVVAAYLVGSRGTPRHAVLLGAVVTTTHVAGVFMLGVIVLFLSKYVVPDQLYPWLGFISGMMITLVGAQQFVQRYTIWKGDAREDDHTHAMPDKITLGNLMAMGVSGGMVPCPSALVVLLGAIALGRVKLGLVLIIAFSFGLATVLIATGLLMLYAQQLLDRLRLRGRTEGSPIRSKWRAAAGVFRRGGAAGIGDRNSVAICNWRCAVNNFFTTEAQRARRPSQFGGASRPLRLCGESFFWI